jgi:hypothetical protein
VRQYPFKPILPRQATEVIECKLTCINRDPYISRSTHRPISGRYIYQLEHPPAIMFRTVLLQSTRCFAQRAAQPVMRSAAIRSPFITSQISTPATSLSAVRCYASGSSLGKEEVTGRIVDLLKNFDKVCGGGRPWRSTGRRLTNYISTGPGRFKGTRPLVISRYFKTRTSNLTMGIDPGERPLLQRPGTRQLGHRRGCYGDRRGSHRDNTPYRAYRY